MTDGIGTTVQTYYPIFPMRFLITLFVALSLAACGNNLAKANADYRNALNLLGTTDEAKAEEGRALMMSAAEGGSPDAALTLGYYYLKGQYGFPIDSTKALELFEQAGRAGHIDGQYNAGLAYMRGEGTSIDLKKAYSWFLKAARQNDKGAQYNVAVMLLAGDGVAPDPLAAYAWFTIAAENGYAAAAEDKGAARREITAEQMESFADTLKKIRSSITVPSAPEPPIEIEATPL